MARIPLEELHYFARNVLSMVHLREKSSGAFVLALRGDLGAGKTTFVQALAKELGVHAVVQSPTYVLMKSYPLAWDGFNKLVHIDAYRLEEPAQLAQLRPEEFLHDPHTLVVVEWPERVEGVLPAPDMVVSFSADPPAGGAGAAVEGERYIEVV